MRNAEERQRQRAGSKSDVAVGSCHSMMVKPASFLMLICPTTTLLRLVMMLLLMLLMLALTMLLMADNDIAKHRKSAKLP